MNEEEFKEYCISAYAKDIPTKQANGLFATASTYSKQQHNSDQHKTGQCFMSLVSSYRKINNI